MSSHHFVREGQEPALLILDPVPFSKAADLLEGAPLLLITENVLDEAESWSVKVDVVICSPGQEGVVHKRLQHQQPVVVKSNDSGDWISSGLSYLQKEGYTNVNLLTRRREDVLAAFSGIELPVQVTVFENGLRWHRVTIFRKWAANGQKFMIWPEYITSQLETDGLKLASGEFQTEADGMVSISGPSEFWVGENLQG